LKRIRWSSHALKNLAEREIDREEAERTLADPEAVAPSQPPRLVFMRRYYDQVLQQDVLLRLVVEETAMETVVITVYKTSQVHKYLKGLDI
jgi:hypothetical protein